MAAHANEVTVTGVVADIDNDLARVLIGDDQVQQEEWFFPMQTLPPGTKPGVDILFTERDGRFMAIGFARVAGHTAERSIEDRLARPISARRTNEVRVSDLRATPDDAPEVDRRPVAATDGAPAAAAAPTEPTEHGSYF